MSLFSSLIPFQSRVPVRSGVQGDGSEKRYAQPYYELKESSDAFGLEVYLPGVDKEGLDINVDKDELVVTGRHTWQKPADWALVFSETSGEDLRLRLQLNDAVNVEGIHAELDQGLLRVTLPKPEESKPRKITVS